MRMFLDSADFDEIRELNATGLVDGITTNPTLIANSGKDFIEVTKAICDEVDGPVSAEVVATDYEAMVKEGKKLAALHKNVVVKLPLTFDGLRTCQRLARDAIRSNVTLCFSCNQALLAAKAGATFISPFVGRLDDCNLDGSELIEQIRAIYDQYGFATQILAASIRTANHVTEAALAGADAVTIPPAVFRQLIKHPLTDAGIDAFLADWKKTGQSIL